MLNSLPLAAPINRKNYYKLLKVQSIMRVHSYKNYQVALVLNNRKKALSLAVASASMAIALDAAAATHVVTSESDSGANTLRDAISTAVSGDLITIDVNMVNTITLDSSLLSSDKALIISAPVDDEGKPQVNITASGAGFRLLTLTNAETAPVDQLPFIISGLELTGANVHDMGGAISSNYQTLVVDKSIISGNTALGVGGGIAAYGGELCLQGSELSDNRVEAAASSGGKYAIGGGAAVNGILNVVPSLNVDDLGPIDGVNCLTSGSATALFGSVSADFNAAAADLAGNPDGVDILPSSVSGNTAEVTAEVGFENSYIALGGGLAVLESNFNQTESVLLDNACNSIGDKYSEALQCTNVLASSITGNEARVQVTTADGLPEPQYSVVSGGGVFIGTSGVELGMLLTSKYSDISNNKVTLEGSGARSADIVVGAGVGALNSAIPFGVSSFWSAISGDSECPDLENPKYCGIRVSVGASTVTGNTASLDLELVESGDDPRDLIAGGGIGAVNLFTTDLGIEKYNTLPAVQSFFSTISGNTINASTADEYTGVHGAGIAVGRSVIDAPAASALALSDGKYVGLFSGNSENTVLVTGASNAGFNGIVSGGGVSAANPLIIGKKPEFAVISDEEPEEKYGLAIDGSLFTSPGGIAGNSIELSTSGGGVLGVIAGGGVASTGKYGFQLGTGALISGNQITVNASTSEGSIFVAGGGGAVVPVDGGESSTSLSSWKYSVITNNSVTVTGGADLSVEAFGGGLGLGLSSGDGRSAPLLFSMVASEVSGNTIELTSVNTDSSARGGGVAGVAGAGDGDGGKYGGNVVASTIAGNTIALSGAGGSVAGAGLFLDIKYDGGGILNTTIAGNTGSLGGAPGGGQVYLVGDLETFQLHNSIVTGETAQGETDVYYESEPDVAATAVLHGVGSPISGFLAPAIADPAFLGDLQFNGSNFSDGDDKYGFYQPTATIALLPGNGAIDPTESDACISAETNEFDQRGYLRDECPDLGAYERSAETDGDGLADEAELGAAATDPDILASLEAFPPPYGLLLASGDGNSDGFPDVDQSFVASFTSETAGALTLFVNDPGPSLGMVTPAAGMMAGGFDLSLGGVSFSVLTDTDTDPVELSLIAPAVDGFSLSLVKQMCNPAPANPDEGWEILDDSPEPFGDGRVRFTFVLEPGGPFDCNGDAPNIEDPIFIAQAGNVAPTPVPSMPAMLYGLLTGAIGVLGMLGLRSRKKKSLR
ncbi:MAG: hypothetical protein ACJA09_000662 [Alcanivorax sp.]|jgi:hypothetical protein